MLVVTEKGLGKCSHIDDYRVQKRGGKGIITVNRTEKTGDVVALMEVLPEDEIMLITRGGIVIRSSVAQIRVTGRNAQGVRLVYLDEGDVGHRGRPRDPGGQGRRRGRRSRRAPRGRAGRGVANRTHVRGLGGACLGRPRCRIAPTVHRDRGLAPSSGEVRSRHDCGACATAIAQWSSSSLRQTTILQRLSSAARGLAVCTSGPCRPVLRFRPLRAPTLSFVNVLHSMTAVPTAGVSPRDG